MPDKPDRPVPGVLFQTRHEVLAEPVGGVDWTIYKDWDTQMQLRWARNVMIKEQLQRGQNVCYRSSGQSMWPIVKSGDLCEFAPFPAGSTVAESIEVRDIVFCEVQPHNRFVAHFVLEKKWDKYRQQHKCIIGNKDGYVNGHCFMETIYGKLIWTGDVGDLDTL